MDDPILLLAEAVSAPPRTRPSYPWAMLKAAVCAVGSRPPAPHEERALLAVLRFTGTLSLDDTSDLPHSMSPEEMLKSLAIQALGRWTGLAHVPVMRRVMATAASPALASVVRAVINRAEGTAQQAEAVAAVPSPPAEEEEGEEDGDGTAWGLLFKEEVLTPARSLPRADHRTVNRLVAWKAGRDRQVRIPGRGNDWSFSTDQPVGPGWYVGESQQAGRGAVV